MPGKKSKERAMSVWSEAIDKIQKAADSGEYTKEEIRNMVIAHNKANIGTKFKGGGNANINFKNFPPSAQLSFPQKFHRTVATFVTGYPNITKFGYDNLNDFPEALFTSATDLFFNSIGKQSPVDFRMSELESKKEGVPIYKVFSQKPLSQDQLNDIFSSIESTKDVDWTAAYPHYSSNEKELPPFQLHPGLFYINAIEIASSAMEMSAIGGKNVALLLYNIWLGTEGFIDPPLNTINLRNEL